MAASKGSSILSVIFREQRHLLYFPAFMSLIYGLLRLTGPLFMILIFDRVLPSRSVPTLISLLILLIVVQAFMTLMDYSRRRVLARFGARFQERVEDQIFSATDRGTYTAKGKGKPAAGLNEVDKLRSFFHSGSLVGILDFFWSPLFLIAIFVISPFVGWIVVAGISILILIRAIKGSLDKSRDERQQEASEKVKELKETLGRSRHVIESQQMTAAYNERWVAARKRARDASVEANDWNAWFSVLSAHVSRFFPYSTLAAGAYLTILGEMTIGTMVACMRLAWLVHAPTDRFLKEYSSIGEARTNWRNLDKILSAPQPAVLPLDERQPLRLDQIKVRCPITRNQLLNNISLTIAPGTSVEIIGGAASGKTVLAETLMGRLPLANGKITLGDVDIERVCINDAVAAFGYVPQRADFIRGTIEDNVAGLAATPDAQRLVRATQFAQIHKKIVSLPEGYLTQIDPLANGFSKSERHQLALARAFYPNPAILLLDDPDTTFRNGLAKGLRRHIDRFLKDGGILIVLSRQPLKNFEATLRFTLNNGVLKAAPIGRSIEGKVVRIQNVDAREVASEKF